MCARSRDRHSALFRRVTGPDQREPIGGLGIPGSILGPQLARRVWLFSSGPLGDQGGTDPPDIAKLAASLHFVEHRLFSGELREERLSLVGRALVKGVKAPCGDFRTWPEIDAWAAAIARELEPTFVPRSE